MATSLRRALDGLGCRFRRGRPLRRPR